ncbi:putative mfs multidrug transporter protein [Botrytis fragariae]|uniref:Putative mfs multidrug transporter protein n=1 Tax=Botrytis fragariae TaxID=1964551 RepID=A0A8H6B2B8_9HELO|nr:putative mfs multidrug transporter protein [Botrytis fragariae]KAF5877909.1 putative mfs multidrug transporter protein [Botrytis fragariae]
MKEEPMQAEVSKPENMPVESTQLPSSEQPFENDINGYLSGKTLYSLALSLSICMLLVNIELTVVSTALTSITNDLHGFDKTGWIVTGYLVTYSSTLIIWTKVSDIFGRKSSIITAVLLFTAFSGACGAAQTITQIIICRVFQGIGAAGSMALVFAISFEMIPKHKFPTYTALFSVVTTMGNLVGPLIGGGFSEKSMWRWAFLFNVPAGALALALLFICVPGGFPHQNDPAYVSRSLKEKFSKSSISKIDGTGAFLFLGASLLLVTVLLGAGNQFAWHSATSISLFVISGVLWILFVWNERLVTDEKKRTEPIFPWRFVVNRKWMGALMLSLLSGIPFNAVTINIPQRFQVVDGMSPVAAGVHLIPFNALIAFGTVIANVIVGKAHIPLIYLMFIGSILQIVGISLMSTIPNGLNVNSAIYGYEAIAGLGIGIVYGMVIVIPPHIVERRDLAISSGALLQFRAFGGAIGLAITSAAMNNYLSSRLQHIIDPAQIAEIFRSSSSIASFSPETQGNILEAFAESYSLQMKIMAAFSGLQLLLVSLVWAKPQIRV